MGARAVTGTEADIWARGAAPSNEQQTLRPAIMQSVGTLRPAKRQTTNLTGQEAKLPTRSVQKLLHAEEFSHDAAIQLHQHIAWLQLRHSGRREWHWHAGQGREKQRRAGGAPAYGRKARAPAALWLD